MRNDDGERNRNRGEINKDKHTSDFPGEKNNINDEGKS